MTVADQFGDALGDQRATAGAVEGHQAHMRRRIERGSERPRAAVAEATVE
jgi:hypothetical protein